MCKKDMHTVQAQTWKDVDSSWVREEATIWELRSEAEALPLGALRVCAVVHMASVCVWKCACVQAQVGVLASCAFAHAELQF